MLPQMEKRELIEQLQALAKRWQGIESRVGLTAKQAQIGEIEQQMSAPGFWDDQQQAQKISQLCAELQNFTKTWQGIAQDIVDLPELIDMAEVGDLASLAADTTDLVARFDQAETQLLLSGEYDRNNAILSIFTGNGGQDAEDFSQMLQRMYLRFAETQNWKVSVIEESRSDVGLKSTTLEIKGDYVYGMLQSEHGVHRLIRLSPFNAKNLRQTSFSRVEIMPKLTQDTDLQIDESDLRIDVFRSSGAGGQSVNTTDSAVRVTYLPLNIVVTCQNERSQLQNKATALGILKAKLLRLKLEQQAEELTQLRGDIMENSFGSQIRTYTLQPYKLVKDHRTDTEHNNPDKVFDGDLEPFMQAFLRREEKK